MKKNNVFWIGYSDLMTSLFFVMLVLFVISAGYLKQQASLSDSKKNEVYHLQKDKEQLEAKIQQLEGTVRATKEQLVKVEEIQVAVQKLPSDYFQYQPQYKRFKLNREIRFEKGDSKIKSQEDRAYLVRVGNSIQTTVRDLRIQYKDMDIKYLVIVEGMASKDKYNRNFELSYERALALYNHWKREGISFDPTYCEIQIAGSGTDGIREYAGYDERKNQQFLIHIIPKIGKILPAEMQ